MMKQTFFGMFVLIHILHIRMVVVAHRCAHGKHEAHKPPQMTDDTPKTESRLLEVGNPNTYTSWHPLRTRFVFTPVAEYRYANPATSAAIELMVRVVYGSSSYFGKVLQVNYYGQMEFSGGSCGGTDLEASSWSADLVIVTHPAPSDTAPYITRSLPCYYSKKDGRPLVSALFLNQASFSSSDELKLFTAVLHEMVHILGFDKDLFSNFKVPGTSTSRLL